MNLTHIFLVFRNQSNNLECEVTLFDDAGQIVAPCPIAMKFDVNPIHGTTRLTLKFDAHEAIVRQLTRQITTHDVSMRTPIFFHGM